MYRSIEERELTTQRDAAVSLFKDLQEKIRLQAEEYEGRTGAAEMARIEVEIELERLQREKAGSAMSTQAHVHTITEGWLIGAVLGWLGGLMLGFFFSPVLGFMLVPPSVSTGVAGGLAYARVRDKMGATARGGAVHPSSRDKEEFLLELQRRFQASATTIPGRRAREEPAPQSFMRGIVMEAADVATRSAVSFAVATASYMLGLRPVRRR